MESRGHRRVIGEPARADEAELLAGVPDEEDGAARARALARELLRDLEHGDGAGAVVVGAVEDGVHARRVLLSQRVDVHVNERELLRARLRVVERLAAHLPRLLVRGAHGVVIERHVARADVIAVRADRDVLAA